jgi:hypothetical protein
MVYVTLDCQVLTVSIIQDYKEHSRYHGQESNRAPTQYVRSFAA